jgi:hypothetical protein
LAELVACGRSVERGPFLIDLDGKICCAKSNHSRHRDCKKGIPISSKNSFRIAISSQLRNGTGAYTKARPDKDRVRLAALRAPAQNLLP